MTLDEFPAHIHQLWKQSGLSQEEYGATLGLSRVTINAHIGGRIKPTKPLLDRLGLQYEMAIVPKPKPHRKKEK